MLSILYTFRDIVDSVYATCVNGRTVPNSNAKVYLSDLTEATMIGAFSVGGWDAIPSSRSMAMRSKYVMRRTVENAHEMIAMRGYVGPANPHMVLFVAGDRHVLRATGKLRSVRGDGRARRGAGVVVSFLGSVALVDAIDLAIEGVRRMADR